MTADFSKLDLPKLMADAAKYPNAGVPVEKMDFWRSLDSSLQELHPLPDGDSVEGWLSLVSELVSKKVPSTEDPAPPAISQDIIGTCVKDRQPIPEVCKAISIDLQQLTSVKYNRLQQRQHENVRDHLDKSQQPIVNDLDQLWVNPQGHQAQLRYV